VKHRWKSYGNPVKKAGEGSGYGLTRVWTCSECGSSTTSTVRPGTDAHGDTIAYGVGGWKRVGYYCGTVMAGKIHES
jgi:hypothetical protein